MRKVSLEKNVDMKCMQVNLLKNITKIAKRDGDMQADQICRQCLDTLGVSSRIDVAAIDKREPERQSGRLFWLNSGFYDLSLNVCKCSFIEF